MSDKTVYVKWVSSILYQLGIPYIVELTIVGAAAHALRGIRTGDDHEC